MNKDKIELYKNKQRKLNKYQRELRKSPTPAEIYFTKKLTKLGVKHKTQKAIMGFGYLYFVDFYIRHLSLAIELDGKHHLSDPQLRYDKRKEMKLMDRDIKTVRIQNDVVFRLSSKTIMNILIKHGYCPKNNYQSIVLTDDEARKVLCSL